MDSSSNSNGLDGSVHPDAPHTIPKEDETDAKAIVQNGIENSHTNSQDKSDDPLIAATEVIRLDEDPHREASSLTSGGGDVADARPAAVGANDATDAEPGPTRGRQYENISLPEVFTDRDSLHYNLKGPKRVIIFNHKKFASRFHLNERKGTELDVSAIKSAFKSISWDTEVYNDPTVSDIRSIITELQLSESTESLAAVAVFILSHGEDNGTVFAADAMYRVDNDILFMLTADKCPYLAGKPKLIFVQACQGQNTDPGVNLRRRHTSQDSTSTYKIPNFADFLIFQASFWNHYSFRSSDTGSWFIQALCRRIVESDQEDSLMDTLLEVSRTVSVEKESNVPTKPHLHQKKQTPLLYSTLLRKLYLKGQHGKKAVQASRSSPTSSQRGPELLDYSKSKNKDCAVM